MAPARIGSPAALVVTEDRVERIDHLLGTNAGPVAVAGATQRELSCNLRR
jgi:hypothetical protein